MFMHSCISETFPSLGKDLLDIWCSVSNWKGDSHFPPNFLFFLYAMQHGTSGLTCMQCMLEKTSEFLSWICATRNVVIAIGASVLEGIFSWGDRFIVFRKKDPWHFFIYYYLTTGTETFDVIICVSRNYSNWKRVFWLSICTPKNLRLSKRDQICVLFWGILGAGGIHNSQYVCILTRFHKLSVLGERGRIHNWHLRVHINCESSPSPRILCAIKSVCGPHYLRAKHGGSH